MTEHVILALDKATPQGRAPAAGDTYLLPRSMHVAEGAQFISKVADGASAVAHHLDTENALSTSGSKLFSLSNNTTEKAYFDKDGALVQPGVGGSDNVAIGEGVLTLATAGTQNVAIGSFAMAASSLTSATRGNVAIGASALGAADGGEHNVVLGHQSGLRITFTDFNVMLGSQTNMGVSTGDTGSNNIFIGRRAAYDETGSGKLFIDGYGDRGDEATGRAESIIYGVMSATVGDQELHLNAKLLLSQIPTSDPANAGEVWNDSGTLKVSAG